MPSSLNLFSSLATSATRTWTGINSSLDSKQPDELLMLYDSEYSPYCRLVREALTELNLDAIILPCPKDSQVFSASLRERGGKFQIPYLVDPNSDVEMYESMDIIRYLYDCYADSKLPAKWRFATPHVLNSMIASGLRLPVKPRLSPVAAPVEYLELYSFEASPYARPVREVLHELELPYILRSSGRTTFSEWVLPQVRAALDLKPDSKLKNRRDILQWEGKMSIPYLIDPNTGTRLFESDAIIVYLVNEYAK